MPSSSQLQEINWIRSLSNQKLTSFRTAAWLTMPQNKLGTFFEPILPTLLKQIMRNFVQISLTFQFKKYLVVSSEKQADLSAYAHWTAANKQLRNVRARTHN